MYVSVNEEVRENMEKVQLETNNIKREYAEFEQAVLHTKLELQKVCESSVS